MNIQEKILKLREYIQSVSSTNVKRVKWNSITKDLTVQFNDSTYTYYNIPEAIYNNVVDGNSGTKTAGPWGEIGKYPSVGAAIHQWLIDGGYKYKKGGMI
jgi:hypothetical protein